MTHSIESTATHLADLRAQSPLVHNITNYVAMDVSANALLALGASPAMVHAVEETASFAQISGALVLNIGTLSGPWVEGMRAAADAARAAKVPIVLDPVGVGATPYRTEVAAGLLASGVSVVRANASEVLALAGATDSAPKGVDSSHGVDAALEAAKEMAKKYGITVAVTGELDAVTDGETLVRVSGGSELMTKVTAMGCSSSAAVGAFLASAGPERTALSASVHALAVFKAAGTLAAAGCAGPGSFRTAFLDTLHGLNAEQLMKGAHLS